MGRYKREHNPETLSRVQQAWQEHRAETGTNQTKAAASLGMNQSAFSQYLRGPDKGGVPLNAEFVVKFAALVKKPPSYFDDTFSSSELPADLRPKTLTVPLRYALSGNTMDEKLAVVRAVAAHEGLYAILVDVQGTPYQQGSMLLVDPEDGVKEGDTVAVTTGSALKGIGELAYSDGWVIKMLTGGQFVTLSIEKGDEVHRVTGIQLPEVKRGKAFR